MKNLTYLASPYTHKDMFVQEQRWIDVSRAAGHFVKRGKTVFCPIAMSHSIAIHGGIGGDFSVWEELDRDYLRHSKEFYALGLNGWGQSTGLNSEWKYARELGLPCYWVDPASYEVCGLGIIEEGPMRVTSIDRGSHHMLSMDLLQGVPVLN